MVAGRHDFVIEAGADLAIELEWSDESGGKVDLTGGSAAMQLRYSIADASPVVSLTEAASAHGQIVLGGTAGTLTVKVNAATTGTLTAGPAVYDLLVTVAAGDKTRLIEGTATIREAVTR